MRSLACHQGRLACGRIIAFLGVALMLCLTAKAQNYSSKAGGIKSCHPVTSASDSNSDQGQPGGRLARITAYWPGEDYFTTHHRSATGVRLRPGFCAVDASIIPYGSVVKIPGVGDFLAMDTGTAVISRKAARLSGHNREERSALVVDIYFASRKLAEIFDREGPKFAMVAWESGTLASNN